MLKDQDDECDNNKLTNLDSVTVNRNHDLDNELANKKYVDDSLGEGNVLRFIQTKDNFLEVSVGNDTYNLTNFDKMQITDITIINYPNTIFYLLQNWIIKCNDRTNSGKKQNFVKLTETNSPTGYSGAASLLPIGNSFLYIETSSINHGINVFASFERTDIFQIDNIAFFCHRFSILTNNSRKLRGRFKIEMVSVDNTWSTRYNIPKNDRYSNSSTDWTKIILNFIEERYSKKLIFDEIDSANSDVCFSNITVTHSVF